MQASERKIELKRRPNRRGRKRTAPVRYRAVGKRGQADRPKRRRLNPKGRSNMINPFAHLGPETMFSRTSVTPDKTFCRLRYNEPSYNTGALTGAVMYVDKYALNSTYDPYLGAGGGQPSGLAQMFAKYQFCRVWASTIKFHVTRTEHSSDAPYDICLVPIPYGGTPTPPSTINQYMEQPYAIFQQGVSVYADRPHTIVKRMETPALAGLTFNGLDHSSFWHNNAANAIYQHEWHCIVLQPDAAVNNTFLKINVELIYECEFFMRTANPASLYDEVIKDAIETKRFDIIKESLAGKSAPMPHNKLSDPLSPTDDPYLSISVPSSVSTTTAITPKILKDPKESKGPPVKRGL